ncbi:HNH endonuclease [Deinococcus sp. S9]|uniref:HNH endonuclease n=1 Tax=Deinococcus sp. S9 TaxID=2545754 RepID=UPI001055A9CA|nr:HNH endonuclease [Deinococcus sp. S9]
MGCHLYRARKMAAPGRHTAEDVKRQLASQNGLCYWCQQPLETYQVDHLIPLARGGSNGPENIVCACQSCNSRKHAKMPWEFAGRLL